MRPEVESPAPAPIVAENVYDENGVDRSLIRWMLSLTPSERLQYAQSAIDLQASVVEIGNESR